MFKVNDNYLKLPGSYLFSTIGKKVNAYKEANPDKVVISLGIGDVTQPLAPAIIDSLHKAVDEMAVKETFKGYRGLRSLKYSEWDCDEELPKEYNDLVEFDDYNRMCDSYGKVEEGVPEGTYVQMYISYPKNYIKK